MCCPSRVAILTSQYSHTSGVWANDWPNGGYLAFHGANSTIATWLQSAGYTTALIGKYLNQYRAAAFHGVVPPGWNRWVSFAADNGKHFNYWMTFNGQLRHYGDQVSDFSTDVLANQAVDFIRQTKGPLFLYFAPYAPHTPYDAPASDSCGPLGLYHSESWGEQDVSDKPPYVANSPWGPAQVAETRNIREGQCALTTGVDRSVGEIVSALQATNRLQNTMIVYMSDNGYMWGEHRLFHKSKPYDEAIRVPMVIRYDPMISAPRVDSHMVLNLDIAPTFAALGGAAAPGAEGRSLLPLLEGQQVPWRDTFLLEHSYGWDDGPNHAPDFCGLRTTNWMYTMYMGGAEELYDLRTDPAEMNNVAGLPSAQAQRDRMRAEVFRRCQPLPPRFHKT
jgi:arylsulfatase A-like enzyme